MSILDNNRVPDQDRTDIDSAHENNKTDHTGNTKTGPVALIPEYLESLIPGYIKNRRADIVKIRQLVRNSEFEEAQRLAHSMKGSGGGYGFQEISELGSSMEIAAKSLNGNKILSEIDKLEEYLDTVRMEYVDDDG